jgi:hypothetical protein
MCGKIDEGHCVLQALMQALSPSFFIFFLLPFLPSETLGRLGTYIVFILNSSIPSGWPGSIKMESWYVAVLKAKLLLWTMVDDNEFRKWSDPNEFCCSS